MINYVFIPIFLFPKCSSSTETTYDHDRAPLLASSPVQKVLHKGREKREGLRGLFELNLLKDTYPQI